MEKELAIRESLVPDRVAIESLYPKAFPDEDLLPLVREQLRDPYCTISLVAVIDSTVVGNIIFTKCGVSGCNIKAALLAPLAVDPIHQKQGVGSALIQAGLRRLREEAFSMVFVLGDPAYYGRFGFETESSIGTPYPIPPEWSDAWQSQWLVDAGGNHGGKLSLPRYWLDPALWSA